jgi:hypothetical protein
MTITTINMFRWKEMFLAKKQICSVRESSHALPDWRLFFEGGVAKHAQSNSPQAKKRTRKRPT